MILRICPYTLQVNSVAKIFNGLVHPRDQLFEDRHEKLLQAVETVNREIPATDLLHNGDMDEAVKCLLPIVEAVYNMPDLRPESGTEKWVEYMKKNIDQTTFRDLVSYPALLKIFVKKMEKKGTDRVCSCFLMLLCVCPYSNMFVSLYLNVCPYAIMRMSLCHHACVLTLSGNTKFGDWRQIVLANLCCGETLRFGY